MPGEVRQKEERAGRYLQGIAWQSCSRSKDLRTHFETSAGLVRAVDGISYDVEEGETVAIVGESGCGKSVSALSILRLIADPPGRVVGGSIRFNGRDLLTLSEEEIRKVRGRDIAMIFQEPMTSLNPVLTIGRQLTETLEQHSRYRHGGRGRARDRAARHGGHRRAGAAAASSIRITSAAACASA